MKMQVEQSRANEKMNGKGARKTKEQKKKKNIWNEYSYK